MRLYLDACAIQRPLDPLRTPAVRLEAESVEWLLDATARRIASLVWSIALDYECVLRAPGDRAEYSLAVRRLADLDVDATPPVVGRAELLAKRLRLKTLDALHLACAESADATLVTVDGPFLRRAGRSRLSKVRVMDPIEAVAWLRTASRSK